MGFRQKSRGIKVRRYEMVAIILAALTTATGIGWKTISPQSGWIVTRARVTGVSAEQRITEASRGAPAMFLEFEYIASGGAVYRGKTQLEQATEMLYGALPEHIKSQLRERGFLEFDDLPEEAQILLRERGVSSFDKIPVGFLAAMEAQGYDNVSDIPDDIRQMVRNGEYVAAAEAMGYSGATVAALIAGSVESEGRVVRDYDAVRPASVLSGTTGFTTAPERPALLVPGKVLHVRYDPERPERHEIVRIPYLDTVTRYSVFLAFALITLIYCGVTYPRLKQT